MRIATSERLSVQEALNGAGRVAITREGGGID